MKNFVEELRWRGMLHDMTPGIEEILSSGQSIVGYIGFDPTAPSLTIGNFVQLQILKLFQDCGHTPIVLMGGATGRIGDPSFKDKERELKTPEQVDKNLAFQLEQVKKYLRFDGDQAAILVNNYDFYKNMNVLDFLRDVGKSLTVSYMMSKDSVKNRLETGLSFTEFSYQLLQGYDFQCLYTQYGCILQMGGSDQWGNITSGTEFIRRNITDGKAYALTTPLLTKSDGKKFGKSEEGNIWLDPKLTSPYKFFQFWINSDDADVPKYLKYFSLKSHEEIEATIALLESRPEEAKLALAQEITERIHGAEALATVKQVSSILFSKDLTKESLSTMSKDVLEMVAGEIPSYTISASQLAVSLAQLLTETCPIFASKGDLRRALQSNAVAINKEKVNDHEHIIPASELIQGTYVMVESGKKNKYIIRITE